MQSEAVLLSRLALKVGRPGEISYSHVRTYHPLLPSHPLSRRIISGGRYGEVRVWSLEDAIGDAASDCECEEEIKSRELRLHDRSTAVGQVKLLRAQAGIMRAR